MSHLGWAKPARVYGKNEYSIIKIITSYVGIFELVNIFSVAFVFSFTGIKNLRSLSKRTNVMTNDK
jgi:hypothetical protein